MHSEPVDVYGKQFAFSITPRNLSRSYALVSLESRLTPKSMLALCSRGVALCFCSCCVRSFCS